MRSNPGSSPVAGIIATGLIALAIAMGIGRFAFTPLLPLMLRDGDLDPIAGAEWAMANYLGYLVGALTSARFAFDPRRACLTGLAGVAFTTIAIGLMQGGELALGGPLLRAAAGVFSAWVLVGASTWCLIELAHVQRTPVSAWIYTGVGVGIALAGLATWLGGAQPARWLWLELGALAAIGAWAAARISDPTSGRARNRRGADEVTRSMPTVEVIRMPGTKSNTVDAQEERNRTIARADDLPLIVCYGIFGYGYIVLASFLPAIAREQVDDPLLFGLAWPVFGLAATLSVAAAARWGASIPREHVWSTAQAVMALGTALPLFSLGLATLVAAAVLIGGTFMVATMAGLQLARDRHPANPTPLVARMTIAFAIGQVAGPTLVRALVAASIPGPDALNAANLLATAMLSVSALWLWRRGTRVALTGRRSANASQPPTRP